MRDFNKAIAFIFVLVVFANCMFPIRSETRTQTGAVISNTPWITAATNLVVTNKTLNYNQSFNDDDFQFYVKNYTFPIAGALVSLYYSSNLTLYSNKTTVGDGSTIFYNVPRSTYIWNVTLASYPGIFRTGIMVSHGPEAFATVRIGNLDWSNNDDDLNASVVDIEGKTAKGLNFSIVFRDNVSVWSQVVLGTSGIAYFSEIPKGNYTWKVTVMTGTYAGYVIQQANFVSDGTSILVHDIVAPLVEGAQYYGLEVFTYYETSLTPVSGALVNVTYRNGTEIDYRYTPTNGTVRFLTLPVAFVNWTVTLDAKLLENHWYNLTSASTDIRKPVITSPGDREFLYGTKNSTITWTVADENPKTLKIYVNSALNKTVGWASSPFNCTFNVTGYALGRYSVQLVADDKNSNEAKDTINLRIYENITPVIVGPSDVEYYFNETGHSIRWNITEAHMDMYMVIRNGTALTNGSLQSEKPYVLVSVDGLSIGTYVYSCRVNDTSGNFAIDNVTVSVKRYEIPPEFLYTPPTVYYSLGDMNIIRNWTVQDKFKLSYNITVDAVLVVSDLWRSENITFDFSGLSQGQHLVVLTVADLGGNMASSQVIVIVYPPLIVEAMIVGAFAAGGIVVVALVVWFVKYR
jgi:hypothetical protein